MLLASGLGWSTRLVAGAWEVVLMGGVAFIGTWKVPVWGSGEAPTLASCFTSLTGPASSGPCSAINVLVFTAY